MKSSITTHVLDTMRGRPAEGITIVLESRSESEAWKEMSRSKTNADGRIENLLPPNFKIPLGVYRLTFLTAEYFRTLKIESFYPFVTVTFEIRDTALHYHVPLLLSPHGYSTYRGS